MVYCRIRIQYSNSPTKRKMRPHCQGCLVAPSGETRLQLQLSSVRDLDALFLLDQQPPTCTRNTLEIAAQNGVLPSYTLLVTQAYFSLGSLASGTAFWGSQFRPDAILNLTVLNKRCCPVVRCLAPLHQGPDAGLSLVWMISLDFLISPWSILFTEEENRFREAKNLTKCQETPGPTVAKQHH